MPANDPGTFGLQIDGQTKATGGNGTTTGSVELSSGAHTVAEIAAGGTNLANYVSSIGGACQADGSVSLAAGENKTCTITNTRKARLFVIKKVINDNGGTAAPGDFTLGVNATDPTPASFKGADAPGVEVTAGTGPLQRRRNWPARPATRAASPPPAPADRARARPRPARSRTTTSPRS